MKKKKLSASEIIPRRASFFHPEENNFACQIPVQIKLQCRPIPQDANTDA